MQSRSGEEEGEERCGASVETDDEAWAGCKATLRVAPRDSGSLAPASSLALCDAPHHGAPSSSHLPKDKDMKSFDNF
ncbi:MAG: hypothetical protein ACR2QH_09425 [Geminicoccaceae bacterium]